MLASQGQSIADAVRAIGVTEVTYYRWRQEYGGLKSDQVRKLKDLEAENARLRGAVSDLTLDKMILKEAARGNFEAPRAASILCREHDFVFCDVARDEIADVFACHLTIVRGCRTQFFKTPANVGVGERCAQRRIEAIIYRLRRACGREDRIPPLCKKTGQPSVC